MEGRKEGRKERKEKENTLNFHRVSVIGTRSSDIGNQKIKKISEIRYRASGHRKSGLGYRKPGNQKIGHRVSGIGNQEIKNREIKNRVSGIGHRTSGIENQKNQKIGVSGYRVSGYRHEPLTAGDSSSSSSSSSSSYSVMENLYNTQVGNTTVLTSP